MIRFRFIPVIMIWLCSFVGISSVAGSTPIELKPGRKQLFLDDYLVEQTAGLQSTMHPPEKRGAVLKPDTLSDGNRVQTYGTVPMRVPDEGVLKMVYMAIPMENYDQIGSALAISKDGVHWEKPNLGQNVSVGGSTLNNRVFVDRELRWGDNALWNVIYDPNDPDPNRRYKALLGAQGRSPVVSRDGIHWEKLPCPKISSGDTSTLTFDSERRQYLAFLKGHNQYGRAATLSISDDFEHWSKPRLCFSADDIDQIQAVDLIRRRMHDRRLALPLFNDPDPALGFKPPERYIPTWRAECYAFSAFPYEGIYIGLPMMYYPTGQELPIRDNTDGFHLIQLAMSRDLVDWKRIGNRQPFLGPSPIDKGLVGVFDRQELIPPSQPLAIGDELWFYYTGFKTRIPPYSLNPDGTPRDPATLNAEERADLKDGWSAICLAVLRRDGFVSLDAGVSEGSLLTRPLKLNGKTLLFNMNAAEGGVRVEIFSEDGKPIPDFSGTNAATMQGDGVRLPVQFKSVKTLDTLAGTTVRLKVHMRSASLYAIWTE